ncbi:hypothetical protein F2Q70_00015441 [Brassica cretica]|uniref:Uncharacterized protein n=1 Tax=Brassica cretica TaxID=69181 RepID=A0A8S9HS43_BRACR|nr:hypothetical protein F2Q70_00015441 [Brassica cretica]
MENIELGRAPIDEDVMLSSDVETKESTDTELPTSIDTAQPEAGKSSLTELIDEEVVQTEPIALVEIKNSLNSLHSFLQNQHRSDKVQIKNDALSDMKNRLEEETSYSDPYPVFNIDSFTQAYDIAVKSRTGKEKFNIKQALTGNHSLSELIRKLESQVAEIATAIKRETGRLPGRTDLNPRRQVSVVMLRSGKRLATNTKNNNEIGSSANADETGESNSQPILLDDPDPKPSHENRKSTAKKNKEKTIDLEVEDDSDIEAEIDQQYGNHVDRPVKPVVDHLSDNPIDRHSTQPEPTIERVDRTLPPYPPKTQTKKSLEYAICKKALDRITMKISLRNLQHR